MNALHVLLRRMLLLVTIAGSALSLPIILKIILSGADQDDSMPFVVNTAALYQQGKPIVGLPTRLKIPRINVKAAIERVGLTAEGAVGVPKSPVNAAWYSVGPRPGEKGSAVIDGHFGWKNGIPAVFDKLYLLYKGDRIYIQDDRGMTTTFIVRELRKYGQYDNAGGVFISTDEKVHLALITCEGTWNKTKKSYSDRLVVFADKEEVLVDEGD